MTTHICPATGTYCCDDLCSSNCIVNGEEIEYECFSCGKLSIKCMCDEETWEIDFDEQNHLNNGCH